MCQPLTYVSTSLDDVKPREPLVTSIYKYVGGFLHVSASSCLLQGCHSFPAACCSLLVMVAGQGKNCADASFEVQRETSNFPKRGVVGLCS